MSEYENENEKVRMRGHDVDPRVDQWEGGASRLEADAIDDAGDAGTVPVPEAPGAGELVTSPSASTDLIDARREPPQPASLFPS